MGIDKQEVKKCLLELIKEPEFLEKLKREGEYKHSESKTNFSKGIITIEPFKRGDIAFINERQRLAMYALQREDEKLIEEVAKSEVRGDKITQRLIHRILREHFPNEKKVHKHLNKLKDKFLTFSKGKPKYIKLNDAFKAL